MAKKMLYVSDEDEAVWNTAMKLGARSDASMSKLVALALREYVASRPSTLPRGVQVEGDAPVRRIKQADRELTTALRDFLRRFGRDKVALAYAHACYEEGARERAMTAALAVKGDR